MIKLDCVVKANKQAWKLACYSHIINIMGYDFVDKFWTTISEPCRTGIMDIKI